MLTEHMESGQAIKAPQAPIIQTDKDAEKNRDMAAGLSDSKLASFVTMIADSYPPGSLHKELLLRIIDRMLYD